MQQVIMNLAVNARDAMPEGGHLHISLNRLQLEDKAVLPIPEMTPGTWVQIEVTDSGTGIPEDALSHIFEPFFTTKEVGKGTGLGLAQVYGIVQQHDGYIDVSSWPGEGTTFRLYLPPREKWQARAAPTYAAARAKQYSSWRMTRLPGRPW
jgi:signal transduction histidine kinase